MCTRIEIKDFCHLEFDTFIKGNVKHNSDFESFTKLSI